MSSNCETHAAILWYVPNYPDVHFERAQLANLEHPNCALSFWIFGYKFIIYRHFAFGMIVYLYLYFIYIYI